MQKNKTFYFLSFYISSWNIQSGLPFLFNAFYEVLVPYVTVGYGAFFRKLTKLIFQVCIFPSHCEIRQLRGVQQILGCLKYAHEHTCPWDLGTTRSWVFRMSQIRGRARLSVASAYDEHTMRSQNVSNIFTNIVET